MPNKKVVVLPSEAAQYLANHLEAHEDEFAVMVYDDPYTEDRHIEIDRAKLAKVIQDYWDSLP